MLEAVPGWSIKDGSIFDSAEIVTRQMYRQGFLGANEWLLYGQIYEALAASCAPPALVLFLNADLEVLLARVRERSREFERGITADFLEGLNRGYAEWVSEWKRSPLVAIDTSRLNTAAVAEAAFDHVCAVIDERAA
jgi:deoxyadenosine/deoxycytidine kinase